MVGELTGGVCEDYMEMMQTDSFQFDGGAGGTSVKYIDATRVSGVGSGRGRARLADEERSDLMARIVNFRRNMPSRCSPPRKSAA
jgi:hypothetical protein